MSIKMEDQAGQWSAMKITLDIQTHVAHAELDLNQQVYSFNITYHLYAHFTKSERKIDKHIKVVRLLSSKWIFRRHPHR